MIIQRFDIKKQKEKEKGRYNCLIEHCYQDKHELLQPILQ